MRNVWSVEGWAGWVFSLGVEPCLPHCGRSEGQDKTENQSCAGAEGVSVLYQLQSQPQPQLDINNQHIIFLLSPNIHNILMTDHLTTQYSTESDIIFNCGVSVSVQGGMLAPGPWALWPQSSLILVRPANSKLPTLEILHIALRSVKLVQIVSCSPEIMAIHYGLY